MGTAGSGHEYRSVETLREYFGVDGEGLRAIPRASIPHLPH